jgi:hypothetical protein
MTNKTIMIGLVAVAFVLLIPITTFGEIENDDNQFHV